MNYMLQKKLNNKGYMLVEIIIASVLAFSVTYYLLNLTYEFKDKNEDVYFSTAILSDKINITKNIMNDLEGKSVSILSYNNSSNPLYVELVVGDAEGSSIKRISIDKNTNTITYGMYNQYREKYIVTDDNTYYQKEIDSFLEFGEIKLEGNLTRANSDYVYIIIPISNIYSDETYDIRLLVRTDIKLGGQKYRIQINLENTGTPNNVTSQIYLNYNDGVYLDEHLSASKKMTTSSNPVIKPTRTGYTFGGYYTGTGGSGTQLINKNGYITSNFTNTYFNSLSTLYVKWEATPYNISYNYNGGTNPGNPATYNTNTNTFKLKNPTKIGYTFKGWTGSNGNTPQTTVTISKGSTGNKSYTANWTRNFTCASKGGTTTYMGKSWYTINNSNGVCDLALNDVVGSSSGNTYTSSTGTSSGSVYSYIKNYSNGTNTIAQEYSAGLIRSIDSISRASPCDNSKIKKLYWAAPGAVCEYADRYNYYTSKQRISFGGGWNNGQEQGVGYTEIDIISPNPAPIHKANKIFSFGNNNKYYVDYSYKTTNSSVTGSLTVSTVELRLSKGVFNLIITSNGGARRYKINDDRLTFKPCGNQANNTTYIYKSSLSNYISKKIEFKMAGTPDISGSTIDFSSNSNCKKFYNYELTSQVLPIYYRPHISVKL